MTLALIGAGVMGQTLLGGLLRAGRDAADVLVVDRRAGRGQELHERFGVRVVEDVTAVASAKTVLLAVKPQDLPALLDSIAAHLAPDVLLVSLAAGVTTAAIEARVPAGTAVVRVMPNTPSLVDEGMAGLAAGSACADSQLAEAEDLMRSCGKAVVLAEKHLDAVTALSGSGPAYVFYVVEAMVEAGVLLGLPRATATELVVQTVVGAGAMLRETGQHPTVLREQVTSPAGTTAAALRQLDDSGVRAALVSAVEAAAARSKQLSGG
ncbi:pyrroline-5-carboxylate reductase [Kineococcus rhizosphaerae]|uniref:Pyrroline-5-carboxylate reductase n=1 Tax=Kineococcus rhizosphaerae TaxID=559628 RepID=A0A2T0R5J6_9ACTN|nr:pyrroline-5-carboxylate reductase [Kineococcus rhizosphaerae]PRY15987.1 pyrroline-5-carboxylate reductase [Kineococcus rhizosphaerae]